MQISVGYRGDRRQQAIQAWVKTQLLMQPISSSLLSAKVSAKAQTKTEEKKERRKAWILFCGLIHMGTVLAPLQQVKWNLLSVH